MINMVAKYYNLPRLMNILLNGKYIKTKHNSKLKAKFFNLFQVIDWVGKQAYKPELFIEKRIYDDFYPSLLEHNSTKKKQVNKLLELE